VSYEMLGPVFDNDLGVMYTFKLQDCLDLAYNPLSWKEFYVFSIPPFLSNLIFISFPDLLRFTKSSTNSSSNEKT